MNRLLAEESIEIKKDLIELKRLGLEQKFLSNLCLPIQERPLGECLEKYAKKLLNKALKGQLKLSFDQYLSLDFSKQKKYCNSWLEARNLRTVDEVFLLRSARETNPEGDFDKKGRFYPCEHHEKQGCCDLVRSPSAHWPYSYMIHCRTKKHIMSLAEAFIFSKDPNIKDFYKPEECSFVRSLFLYYR